MGAEEISRKGISNVEQGLTKVTGINSVEGRGLFVRGLKRDTVICRSTDWDHHLITLFRKSSH